MGYKLDRVARSLQDLLTILDQIKAAGALVRSLTEPLDTTSAMGAFVIQILGAVAQLERGIATERPIAEWKWQEIAEVHRRRSGTISPTAEVKVMRLYDSSDCTMKAIALIFEVSESVIKRSSHQ